MTITATEFKTNFGKYLDAVTKEDIYITKNGKIIAQLTIPQINKIAILDKLVGFAETKEQIDIKEIKEERLRKK